MSQSNLSLVLQYAGQYDPMVEAELQQLVASIQQWANQTFGSVSSFTWQDIDPASVQFVTDTGTWTVPIGNVECLRYRLIGDELLIQFYIGLCAVTGPPNQLQIVLPLPFTVQTDVGRSVGYLHGVAGHSASACIVTQDLDVYADGIVVANTLKGNVTLVVMRLAAGTISSTGFAGCVGLVSCKVRPTDLV